MKTGQKIYLKPIGNAARYSDEIIETTITKVGRKYFVVEYHGCNRISIEDMIDDRGGYISNYAAYMSMEEIEEEKEYVNLYSELKKHFSGYGVNDEISLSQLKEIKRIIDK